MDFTREPIIETIITPRDGYKLVIRSSANTSQEEYFVDAVEVVAFGNALFFRSLERPKAFLVPVSDYEVVEVREARMVLKNVGLERSIKIAGGREGHLKAPKESEKTEAIATEESSKEEAQQMAEAPGEGRTDIRVDKKRERRRNYRKRKGREEGIKDEGGDVSASVDEKPAISISSQNELIEKEKEITPPSAPNLLSSLLQPPSTLISETINRYRQNDLFKGAFYLTEEEQYKPHGKVQDLLNEDHEELIKIPHRLAEVQADKIVEGSPENVDSSEVFTMSPQQENFNDIIPDEKHLSNQELGLEEIRDDENQIYTSKFFIPELPIYAQEEDVSMWPAPPSYIVDSEKESHEKKHPMKDEENSSKHSLDENENKE